MLEEVKQKEVKQQFDQLRSERSEAEKKRFATTKRLEKAEKKNSALRREYDAIKMDRQKTLADGGDHAALSKKLKGVEDDIALVTEEITGLKSKIENLMQLDASLGNQISTEKVEVAKVRIIELAAQYNELAKTLAPIVKNIMHCKDDLAGAHVVWSDWNCEIFQKVPRISFESNVYDYFYHKDKHGI